MDNTVKIVKAIERTHLNLGIPTVLAKMVDLANLGCFLVASRGRGKTTVLDAVKELRHRDVLIINVLTPSGARRLRDVLNNNSVTLINKDFSSFYTEYLKDAGINFIASLITDHSYRGTTSIYNFDLDNVYVSFLSAVQPKMLSELSSLPGWESMYKDRFLRISLLYWRGKPKPTSSKPEVPKVEMIADPSPISIPESLRDSAKYKRLLKIFTLQTSEGRAKQHLEALLKASAALNNREVVIKDDLDFLDAASLYFVPDILLGERISVGSPLVFNDDAYVLLEYIIEKGEATKREIMEDFKISMSTLTRDIKPLLSLGIVSGVFGEQKYTINEKFRKKYIVPLERWINNA